MNAKELGVACAFPSNDMQLLHRVGMAASMSLPTTEERDAAYVKASVAAAAGLTKRELFALVMCHASHMSDGMAFAADVKYTGEDFTTLAHEGVRMADALLEELAKDQP